MNKLFHALFRFLGKSSPALFGAVLAGSLLSPFYAGAASAASLTVAVKQVNSDSAVKTVTCAKLQKNCVLPFVINAGQPTQQSLNINVTYVTGGMVLSFQTSNGYFYTDTAAGKIVTYNTLWIRPLQGSTPATSQVTLFQPFSPLLGMPGSPNANYSSFASLAITATPNP